MDRTHTLTASLAVAFTAAACTAFAQQLGAAPIVPARAAADGAWRFHTCTDCFQWIDVAPDGGVWGGSQAGGLTRWEPSDGTWRTFTTADGLAGNGVSRLEVDASGGVWALTDEGHFPQSAFTGLSHYDGSRWATYTTAEGLPSDNVTDLDADPAGGIWVSTSDAGVAHFDGRDWTHFTADDGLSADEVTQAAIAPDGTAYFATSAGLSRLRDDAWTTFVPPAATTMVVDGRGLLWMGMRGIGILSFDGAQLRAYSTTNGLPSDDVVQLAVDGTGDVWMLAGERPPVLCRFDGRQWIAAPIPSERRQEYINRMAAGPDGSIYLSSFLNGGVQRLLDGQWTDHRASAGPDTLIAFGIAFDPDGKGWVLPFENGRRYALQSFDGAIWSALRGARESQGLFITHGLAVDSLGNVWHGDFDSSVARFDGESWRAWRPADGLPDSRPVDVVVDAEDRIWVATARGAGMWDGSSWRTFTTDDGLPTDDVESIAVDASGAVWFGTDGAGLARWDGSAWRTFTTADGLGSDTVYDIALGAVDIVWAADEETVSRYDGTSWTWSARPSASTVDAAFTSIVVDGAGRLWHGTPSSAIARLDGADWQVLDSTGGLPSDAVFDLALDADGHVWAATIMGVAEFVPGGPTVTPRASPWPTSEAPSDTPTPGTAVTPTPSATDTPMTEPPVDTPTPAATDTPQPNGPFVSRLFLPCVERGS